MTTIEEKATELKRLAESGRDSFAGNPSAPSLSRYVTGLIVPPLQEAVREISTRTLPSHRVEDVQGPVIHYTSLQTAFGLLHGAFSRDASASLRLYDSEHTNDPQEGSYFFHALDLPKHHQWVTTETPSHAYLTSFLIPSQEEDLSDDLTFWRSYGRNGNGCSLKIWVPPSTLQKVLYGAEGALHLRADLLRVMDALHPIAHLSEAIKSTLRETIWEGLGSIRYLYKDKAYSSEKECRVVISKEEVDESDVQFDFRSQPPALRRFCEHPDLSVRKLFGQTGASIMVGPAAPDREDIGYSLDLMKRRAKLYGVDIKVSRISYRPD